MPRAGSSSARSAPIARPVSDVRLTPPKLACESRAARQAPPRRLRTAVDAQVFTGDEARVIGDEERDRFGDVVGRAQTAERDTVGARVVTGRKLSGHRARR